MEAATSALTIARGVIPPTINHSATDPDCPLDIVANQPRETSRVRHLDLPGLRRQRFRPSDAPPERPPGPAGQRRIIRPLCSDARAGTPCDMSVLCRATIARAVLPVWRWQQRWWCWRPTARQGAAVFPDDPIWVDLRPPGRRQPGAAHHRRREHLRLRREHIHQARRTRRRARGEREHAGRGAGFELVYESASAGAR